MLSKKNKIGLDKLMLERKSISPTGTNEAINVKKQGKKLNQNSERFEHIRIGYNGRWC